MFSDHLSLAACESILRPLLAEAEIVADVMLNEDSLDLLTDLISDLLARCPEEALHLLGRDYPACLAVFLVWKAKQSYQEGVFWPPILSAMGLNDVRWETRLGETFLDSLGRFELPRFAIPGANRYVTPILLHGGIPDSCVDSFFRYVVLPFVRDGLVDPMSISLELELSRKEDATYKELDLREKELRSRLAENNHVLDCLKDYQFVADELAEVKARIKELDRASPILHFLSQEESLVARARDTDKAIVQLIDLRAQAIREIESFTTEDEKLIRSEEEIGSLVNCERCLEETKTLYQAALCELKQLEAQLVDGISSALEVEWKPQQGEAWRAMSLDDLKQAISARDRAYAELSASSIAADEELIPSSRPVASPTFLRWVSGLAAMASLFIIVSAFRDDALTGLPIVALVLAGAAALLWVWSGRIQRSIKRLSHLADVWRAESSAVYTCLCQVLSSFGLTELEPKMGESFELEDVEKLQEAFSVLGAYENSRIRSEQSRDSLREIEDRMEAIRRQNPLLCQGALTGHSLLQRLEEATQRQRKADKSEVLIRSLVDPKLKSLHYTRLSFSLSRVQMRRAIETLGGGAYQTGVEIIQTLQHLKTRSAVLTKRVRSIEGKLARLNILSEYDYHYEELRNLSTQLLDEIKIIADEKGKYAPAFGNHVEEPIARYMLYGGDSALHYLQRATYLVHSGTVSIEPRTSAEKQARRSYAIWVDTLARDESSSPLGSLSQLQARPPQLFLDSIQGNMGVRFPEQQLPLDKAKDGVTLEVIAAGREERLDLMVFRQSPEWCKSDYLEIPLAYPDESVSIRLATREEEVLLSWVIDVPGDKNPVTMFEASTGAKITGDIPRGIIWVLLAPAWHLVSTIRVIEELQLTGNWRGYVALLLDTTAFSRREITFTAATGASLNLPVRSDTKKDPYLTGERAPFSLDGNPVYVRGLPKIVLEGVDLQALGRWRVHLARLGTKPKSGIEPGEKTQDRLVSDLEAAAASMTSIDLASLYDRILSAEKDGYRDVVELPLDLPEMKISSSISSYILHLHGPGQKQFSYSFAIISDAALEFDPALVGLYQEEPFPVQVTMILPEDVDFFPISPMTTNHLEPGFASLTVRSNQLAVEGRLEMPSGGTYRVSIPVPRLFVRLEGGGSAGQDTWRVLEVGISELMQMESPSLFIQLYGWEMDGQSWVELRLEGSRQLVRQQLEEHGVRIGLAQFFDTLRVQGGIGVFTITLYTGAGVFFGPSSVLWVYTQWQVKDLEVDCQIEAEELLVHVEWQEVSEEEERLCRLWPFNAFGSRPLEIPILAKEKSLSLRLGSELYPPGYYVLHFESGDPWQSRSTAVNSPRLDAPNTFRVPFLPAGYAPAGCSVDWSCGVIEDTTGKLYKALLVRDDHGVALQALKPSNRVTMNRLPDIVAVIICSRTWDSGVIQLSPSLPTLSLPIDATICQGLLHYWQSKELAVALVPASTNYGEYTVTDSQAVRLLEAILQSEEVQITLQFPAGTYKVPVQLNDNGWGEMTLVQGVRCDSCGTHFPNQAAFHSHAFTCKGGAKVLRLNETSIEVRAYVLWQPLGGVLSMDLTHREDEEQELLTVDRWCTHTAGKKWTSLSSQGRATELAKEIFLLEAEKRKLLKNLGTLLGVKEEM